MCDIEESMSTGHKREELKNLETELSEERYFQVESLGPGGYQNSMSKEQCAHTSSVLKAMLQGLISVQNVASVAEPRLLLRIMKKVYNEDICALQASAVQKSLVRQTSVKATHSAGLGKPKQGWRNSAKGSFTHILPPVKNQGKHRPSASSTSIRKYNIDFSFLDFKTLGRKSFTENLESILSANSTFEEMIKSLEDEISKCIAERKKLVEDIMVLRFKVKTDKVISEERNFRFFLSNLYRNDDIAVNRLKTITGPEIGIHKMMEMYAKTTALYAQNHVAHQAATAKLTSAIDALEVEYNKYTASANVHSHN